jgi:hypothetical protein
MRLRLTLVAACALALALPSAASAKFSVGISENQPSMFHDPLFKEVGFKQARVIVGWDVALDPTHFDFARLKEYLTLASAAGVEPLISFQHTRGDASRCSKKQNYNKGICKLPSLKAYENAMKKFFAAFPEAKVISPWNEANHFTQPTSRNPAAAAKFANTVAKLCKSCKIVVVDLLDQADVVSAKKPTYKSLNRWVQKFRKALKIKRGICGIHNYSDVNRFRSVGTTAVMKALNCKEYWLTETGGLYDFGSFWSKKTMKGCNSASSCQVKATKYMFSLAKKNKKIKRLYVYTWFGNVTPRFDAGLVADGAPRPALNEIRKYVK